MIVAGKWKKKSLAKRVIGSILFLLIYRLLCCIPLPFTDVNAFFAGSGLGESFGVLNILTGGALSRVSIAGLGISPYISASIFIQIFGIVIPSIAELQRSGAIGRKKIKQLTIGLSIITSIVSSLGILNTYMSYGVFVRTDWVAMLVCTVIMALCSILFAFMGNYIDDELFGNGISLFLLAGILSNVPHEIANMLTRAQSVSGKSSEYWIFVSIVVFVSLVMLIFVNWLNYVERDVRLEYNHKSTSDNELVYENSVLPLKMLPNSVLPVIFASSFLSVFSIIASLFGGDAAWLRIFDMNKWLDFSDPVASIGLLIYFFMIFVFGYYTQLVNMNPIEVASNLKKSGAVIVGVAPGVETENYLKKYGGKLNFLGCFGLCILAALPIVMSRVFGVPSLSFLGTSLIIIVSVINDTWYTWKVEKRSARYIGYMKEMSEFKHERTANQFVLFSKVRP